MGKVIGVIGAMEQEVAAFKEEMTNVVEHLIYQHPYYEGQVAGRNVVLVQSGIGKINAALTVMVLAERFNVGQVINTGSAGALHEKLAIGDYVLASTTTFHDVDVTAFGYEKGQMAGMPENYPTDEDLLTQAQEVAEELGLRAYIGQLVTGDVFINGGVKKIQIAHNFPNALAGDMESAAIGQAAYVLNLPYLVIRAISDTADGEAPDNFDLHIETVGRQSAKLVVELLKHT